ncbi:MAG: glycosyltransferase involved in cell wall biosynthesis [Crocinitomicaceae bacterium]|jgi:glycosyltransferase involved in cell wall biosynthesis
MKPLVSIGMPVYNDISFIESSLKSILAQQFENFVLLISDDGSTDGSAVICAKYAEMDSRITVIQQAKNLGISDNMKFLFNQAKTEYFMWAADDDLWDPSFLSTCIGLLRENPMAIVGFCKVETVDDHGETLEVISNPNYSNNSAYKRLRAFAKNPIDGFGYGLFRREQILKVNFPTWWWPNRKTPYNNIYPSLCY